MAHPSPDTPADPRVSWTTVLLVFAAGALLLQALVAAFVLTSNLRGEHVGDWTAFYAGATIVRNGDGHMLYRQATQLAYERDLFGASFAYMGFALPGFVAIVFSPLAALSFRASYFLWLAVNIGITCGLAVVAGRALRNVDRSLRACIIAGSVFSVPVMNTMLLGQLDLAVLAGVVASYLCLRHDRRIAAGAFLTIALAKPQLAAGVILLLIVKREWRALAAFGASSSIVLLAPVTVLGWSSLGDQAQLIAGFTGSSTDAGVAAPIMINVRGLITSVTGIDSVAAWLTPLALVSGASVIVSIRSWGWRPALDARSWALALLLPLVASPHVHMQSAVLAVAAVVIFVSSGHGRDRIRTQHVLGAFIALPALWFLSLAAVSLTAIPMLLLFAFFVRASAAESGQEAVVPREEGTAIRFAA